MNLFSLIAGKMGLGGASGKRNKKKGVGGKSFFFYENFGLSIVEAGEDPSPIFIATLWFIYIGILCWQMKHFYNISS